jgi:hypothetical protein
VFIVSTKFLIGCHFVLLPPVVMAAMAASALVVLPPSLSSCPSPPGHHCLSPHSFFNPVICLLLCWLSRFGVVVVPAVTASMRTGLVRC